MKHLPVSNPNVLWLSLALASVVACGKTVNQLEGGPGLSANKQNQAQGADAEGQTAGQEGTDPATAAAGVPGIPGVALSSAPVPDTAAIAKLIASDFAKNGGNSASVIYATIDHLAPEKVDSAKLEIVRFGMAKVLNSVSMAPAIVKLQAVDEAKTVFRINLADYKQAAALGRIKSAQYAEGNVSQIGGATVVKGDWLVYALSRPEVYDPLMNLPALDRQLESTLGVNYSKAAYINVASGTSDVVFAGRVLMRVPIEIGGKPGGYYWRSYDFVRADVQNRAFTDPSTLKNAQISDLVAGEFFFSLPNGLQAYYLTGFGNQHRYDVPAPGGGSIDPPVATDYRRPQDGLTRCVGGKPGCGFVINGESCMTCHGTGVNIPKTPAGTNGISLADMTTLINQDRARFGGAIKEMGYDTKIDEPIFATLNIFRSDRKVADKRAQGSEVSGITGK